MIYMLDLSGWHPVGYAPVNMMVQLADGQLAKYYYISAVPTAPGQFTQRGWLTNYGGPGSAYTIFMYNTGSGASY